ncbi:hypothetical protein LSM04_000371 [Trypanosoma melophagium]|uniref:uncharacterized protein n=1 Tax=Trypanosoma melophagium TaxID=715481 RepID=UPI00351A9F91|nr:hypothetical protein LSM04_000371 [Trypanosoma melophagium]
MSYTRNRILRTIGVSVENNNKRTSFYLIRRVMPMRFSHTIMRTAINVHAASSHRLYCSSSSSLGEEGRGSVVSSEELRSALRVLSLSDDATDADIKSRFQQLAKSSHPDVLHGVHANHNNNNNNNNNNHHHHHHHNNNNNNNNMNSASVEKMRKGMEAYRLLRRYTAEERAMILRVSRKMEDTRKRAERMYRGRPRSTVYESHNNNNNNNNSNNKRNSTAEFNNFQRHMEKMRENAPPWNVNEAAAISRAQSLNFIFHTPHTNTNSNTYNSNINNSSNNNRRSSPYYHNVDMSFCGTFPGEMREAQYTRIRRRYESLSIRDAITAVAARYQITLGVCLAVIIAVVIMAYTTLPERRKEYLVIPPVSDGNSHEKGEHEKKKN